MNQILKLYDQVNHYGIKNEITYEVISPGEIIYKMVVKEKDLSNPFAIHGGSLAGFMDAILGVAALSQSAEDEELVSTIELKISYLAPALLGDALIGNGKVIKTGKSIIFSEAEIICPKRNKLIAKGSGTFNRYPISKSPLKSLYTEKKN